MYRYIFAKNGRILRQTSVLRFSQCRLLYKCIKVPIANSYFFSTKFVTLFYRQKWSNSKNKKHTICKNDMFYVHGNFVQRGLKLKKLHNIGVFAWIFDRHLVSSKLSTPMKEFIFLILVFTLITLTNWYLTFLVNQQII